MAIDMISYLMGQQAGGGGSPSGEIEITENGEYDVTAYETATVNVASGDGGYGGVTVIPIQSIAEALPTNTIVTV